MERKVLKINGVEIPKKEKRTFGVSFHITVALINVLIFGNNFLVALGVSYLLVSAIQALLGITVIALYSKVDSINDWTTKIPKIIKDRMKESIQKDLDRKKISLKVLDAQPEE